MPAEHAAFGLRFRASGDVWRRCKGAPSGLSAGVLSSENGWESEWRTILAKNHQYLMVGPTAGNVGG